MTNEELKEQMNSKHLSLEGYRMLREIVLKKEQLRVKEQELFILEMKDHFEPKDWNDWHRLHREIEELKNELREFL